MPFIFQFPGREHGGAGLSPGSGLQGTNSARVHCVQPASAPLAPAAREARACVGVCVHLRLSPSVCVFTLMPMTDE